MGVGGVAEPTVFPVSHVLLSRAGPSRWPTATAPESVKPRGTESCLRPYARYDSELLLPPHRILCLIRFVCASSPDIAAAIPYVTAKTLTIDSVNDSKSWRSRHLLGVWDTRTQSPLSLTPHLPTFSARQLTAQATHSISRTGPCVSRFPFP